MSAAVWPVCWSRRPRERVLESLQSLRTLHASKENSFCFKICCKNKKQSGGAQRLTSRDEKILHRTSGLPYWYRCCESLRPGLSSRGFSQARKNNVMKIWLFDSESIRTAMLSQTMPHILSPTVAMSSLPSEGYKTR